jgi:hypothetical protein
VTLKLKNIQDKKKEYEGKTNKYKEKKIDMRLNHKNTRIKNTFPRTIYFFKQKHYFVAFISFNVPECLCVFKNMNNFHKGSGKIKAILLFNFILICRLGSPLREELWM